MNTDCWLSPEGKIYYGLCHQDIAEDIVEKVYGLTTDTYYKSIEWKKGK